MPRFVSASETRTVRAAWWEEKETCTIRRFNYGDRQYLSGKTVQVGIKPGSDEDTVADVMLEEMNLAILERGIVSWTDEDGEPMPVTRARIEQLTEEDADFILGEIQALNPRKGRDADAQAAFRGGSGSGDPE